MPVQYPFSAVVGSDDMTLALVLTAIDPLIGGVLVRGEKGTAKTTTVRGLAEVLPPVRAYEGDRFSADPDDAGAVSPDGPFDAATPVVERPVRLVELPVGASDDRVTGSLHLDKALREGVVAFEPGLLARAHRGLLYVDEINLLHDHLVDLLLDAAATGRVSVERDGVSVEHAARFVLIGTMNPEEGELRPQLLDRFGLTVEVAAPRDPGARVEVVRRRLAFDADPEGFAGRWSADQQALRERLAAAQALVPEVVLDDETLLTIAEICAAFDVDGLRADLVTARTAAAHAAWEGRTHVTRDDVRAAARLALPHRRRRNPFDEPGIDEQQLDDLLGDDDPTDPGDGLDGGPDDGGPGGEPEAGPQDGPDEAADAPQAPAQPQDDERGEQQPATSGAGTVAGAGTPAAPACSSCAAPARARPAAARAPAPRRAASSASSAARLPAGACTFPAPSPPRRRTSARGAGSPATAGSSWRPPTCAAPRPSARSRTSCCCASTRPARWRRAAAWSRSRPPSCRCCWTRTAAATRWPW